MVLFNFSDEDFCINMGDRIAQLIFEKIKTPMIKEMNELGDTDRGNKGYGSSGMSTAINEDLKDSTNNINSITVQEPKTKTVKQKEINSNKLAQARQMISARQIQKLAKEDQPIFLAIIRTNGNPQEQMT